MRKIEHTKTENLVIKEKDTLVMKEELGLSWRENGKMRGIMKSLGVKMSGEEKMRELANKVNIDNVVSISVCFVFMEKRGKQKINKKRMKTRKQKKGEGLRIKSGNGDGDVRRNAKCILFLIIWNTNEIICFEFSSFLCIVLSILVSTATSFFKETVQSKDQLHKNET